MSKSNGRLNLTVHEGGEKRTFAELKAEFDALYRKVLPYYGDEELALINGVGSAAKGNFFGVEGLRRQIAWLQAQLDAFQDTDS